ncbi:hypothetical protein JOF56_000951 [Kibdelosporangium banguiense]|uniref:Uncharacterized protein n=1 Tax=Kibdelosporangium banguiense TaxID=1365924 RepID=A0ABS4T822_9PSEU|nr:hypothetical protein [Kibdelosporangium banguiense]MBP2320566.1 hypothetical protein [Kibdelosporangium banguiense]
MKLYTIICGTPGLPSSKGSKAHAEWRAVEPMTANRLRGGAIVAPKQITAQGTSVPTVLTVTGDFPYIPVRAGEQGLT